MKAHEKYQSFPEEEKEKRQQYGCEQYKDLSEDEKQKLLACRKIIIK